MAKRFSILILGSFSAGSIENQYQKHLKEFNYDTHCFDIQAPVFKLKEKSFLDKILFKITPDTYYKVVNQEVINFIQAKNFDVILVFKGMELFQLTLQVLKQHTKLLINYNPDHPIDIFSQGAGNIHVKNNISAYDFHISYAKNISLRLQKEKNAVCYTIPFGYDLDLVKQLQQQQTQPFPHFVFIGAYDKERTSKLSQLAYQNLLIYGDRAWSRRNPFNTYVQQQYQQRSIYNEEYYQVIQNAIGVLNFLRKQNIIEDSHNMRTFEVPAIGGLLLAERTTEQQEFFEDNKEAIYFDSLDELRDKMTFLEKNETLVQKIKEAAYRRAITSGYSYKDRTASLINIIHQQL